MQRALDDFEDYLAFKMSELDLDNKKCCYKTVQAIREEFKSVIKRYNKERIIFGGE